MGSEARGENTAVEQALNLMAGTGSLGRNSGNCCSAHGDREGLGKRPEERLMVGSGKMSAEADFSCHPRVPGVDPSVGRRPGVFCQRLGGKPLIRTNNTLRKGEAHRAQS